MIVPANEDFLCSVRWETLCNDWKRYPPDFVQGSNVQELKNTKFREFGNKDIFLSRKYLVEKLAKEKLRSEKMVAKVALQMVKV